jgi:uncharacterized membrane protein
LPEALVILKHVLDFKREVRTVSSVLGIMIGVVLILLGLIFLIVWWAMFIKALMAVIPILLILVGAGALVYFISEVKSKLEVEKEKPFPSEEKTGPK